MKNLYSRSGVAGCIMPSCLMLSPVLV